jgi:hypothetical protein
MPPSFMEPETSLMVLKNLMRKAYDRERGGEPAPEVKPEPVAAQAPAVSPTSKAPPAKQPAERAPLRVAAAPEKEKPGKKVATELAKLVSLRDQGILSEEEFQNARRRLVGTA